MDNRLGSVDYGLKHATTYQQRLRSGVGFAFVECLLTSTYSHQMLFIASGEEKTRRFTPCPLLEGAFQVESPSPITETWEICWQFD